jgi:ubiquinone biosynthesis protein
MELIWFPVVALVALAGIRVIGMRLGLLRAFLVAWAGLATAGILLTAVAGESRSAPRVGLVVVLGLLAMIAWTAVVELFSSARSEPTATGPTNPWRAVSHKVARGWRKAEIAMLAIRFGLSRFGRHHAPEPRGSSTGRALRGALERAGGVYVKLGQFLSTRPDLVSPDIAVELARLQQSVDPITEPVIRAVVAEELAEAFSSFRSFSAEPATAASIAQVHHAELEGGQRVAVKVQRPNVAERVHRDLDILVRLAEKLDRRTQWAHELRVVDTVRSFADAVASELDFEAEARNLRLMASAVSHHPRFVVPQPIRGMTRRRVLVMDWVDGAPLAQAATSLLDRDRAGLAGELLHCFLDQVLTIGTFHADPHPGNIFLTPSGQIALLDCGSIGMLDRRQRGALRSVLVAIANQEPGQLRDALREVTERGGAS